jgi:fatty-acid desaturase
MTAPPPPPGLQQSVIPQGFAKGNEASLIQGALFFIAAAIGVAIAFLVWSWLAGVVMAMAAYIGLSIGYARLAQPRGWPRLRWSEFFLDLFILLTGA